MSVLFRKVKINNDETTYKVEFNDYRVGTVVVPSLSDKPAVYNASTWIGQDVAMNIAKDVALYYDKDVTVNHREKTFSINRRSVRTYVRKHPITEINDIQNESDANHDESSNTIKQHVIDCLEKERD